MITDFYDNYEVVKGLAPITGSDNTDLVSEILDCQKYSEVMVVIMTGVLADADATFPLVLQEGDASNLSDAGDVAAGDVYPAEPSLTFGDDGEVHAFAYKGTKRYLRATIDPANNTGSAPFAILFIGKKKKVGSTL